MVRSESVQSPFRSRWASTALIAGVVTAAVYAYQWNAVYSPERDRLLASISSAQGDLKKAQQTAERWPEFVEESLRLERKLAELQRKLPSVATLVSLAGQIDGLADELGVQVQVRPQPLSEETFELYWPSAGG